MITLACVGVLEGVVWFWRLRTGAKGSLPANAAMSTLVLCVLRVMFVAGGFSAALAGDLVLGGLAYAVSAAGVTWGLAWWVDEKNRSTAEQRHSGHEGERPKYCANVNPNPPPKWSSPVVQTKPSPRPRIVAVSGSTRFIEQMAIRKWELECAGCIAIGCHLLPKDYCQGVEHHFAEHVGNADAMDELHLRKIDLADEVHVVNPGGYIGASTRREIEYARSKGKPVKFDQTPGWWESASA